MPYNGPRRPRLPILPSWLARLYLSLSIRLKAESRLMILRLSLPDQVSIQRVRSGVLRAVNQATAIRATIIRATVVQATAIQDCEQGGLKQGAWEGCSSGRCRLDLYALAIFVLTVTLVGGPTFVWADPPVEPKLSAAAVPIRIKNTPPLPADQIAAAYRSSEPVPQPAATDTEAILESLRQGPSVESSPESANAETPSAEQLQNWIEQLGSTVFASREQATAKLRAVGRPALAVLRDNAENHPDIEVRMRATDVAEGITQSETAGRIDAFLAGQDVGLDGWPMARRILGDGDRIREVYVDLALRLEPVAKALAGSTADRSDALRLAISQIQRGMFVEQRLPTEADALALLLLVNDRDVPMNGVDENALFSVLQKEVTSILLEDAQLSVPFRQLLAGWMTRKDVSDAQEMLWFSMSRKLNECLPLAIQSMKKSNDPGTLSMAAQAVARFGSAENIASLRPLLDDARPASEQQYSAGTIVQAQVRDAAAAAIILLSKRKLGDFQFNEDATHPNFGFIVQEIGFPTDDPAPRDKVLAQVRKELLPAESDAS